VKTSVIVPVLYQEDQLARTLARLNELEGLDLEVVVVVDVPDASRETEARATNDAVAGGTGAVVVYRINRRGFGSALREGFAASTGDVVIPFMGDESDDPQTIPSMVAKIEEGFDVVAGSRYMKGGGIAGDTAKQRLSRLYSSLVRLAGGPPIHDVSNAFKAYRRAAVERVHTVADSFDISVELTVKAAQAGFRIGEVPTVWTNRQLGASNFRMGRELRNYRRWLMLALRGRARLGRRGARASSTPVAATDPRGGEQ
jgi:dolichol-phosphate mannosyltransferase